MGKITNGGGLHTEHRGGAKRRRGIATEACKSTTAFAPAQAGTSRLYPRRPKVPYQYLHLH